MHTYWRIERGVRATPRSSGGRQLEIVPVTGRAAEVPIGAPERPGEGSRASQTTGARKPPASARATALLQRAPFPIVWTPPPAGRGRRRALERSEPGRTRLRSRASPSTIFWSGFVLHRTAGPHILVRRPQLPP